MGLKIKFEYIQKIIVQYSNKKISYIVPHGILSYNHTIDPKECGRICNLSNDYFKAKTTVLDENQQKSVANIIRDNIVKLPFENEFEKIILPPGASHEAYLYCETNNGEEFFYTNIKPKNFTCERIEIQKEFFAAYEIFNSFCEFPDMLAENIFASNQDFNAVSQYDERYFEETLWICNNCHAGNLMEHDICISCKKSRDW